MDTSEEYVKMCDCEGVQGHCRYNNGDWFCDPSGGRSWAMWERARGATDEGMREFMGGFLWLPLQCQIQEMMGIDSVSTFETAVYEMFFESDNHAHYNATPEWRTLDYDSSERFVTPEQLWLAYYMWKEHQKIWDGEKWVSNNRHGDK